MVFQVADLWAAGTVVEVGRESGPVMQRAIVATDGSLTVHGLPAGPYLLRADNKQRRFMVGPEDAEPVEAAPAAPTQVMVQSTTPVLTMGKVITGDEPDASLRVTGPNTYALDLTLATGPKGDPGETTSVESGVPVEGPSVDAGGVDEDVQPVSAGGGAGPGVVDAPPEVVASLPVAEPTGGHVTEIKEQEVVYSPQVKKDPVYYRHGVTKGAEVDALRKAVNQRLEARGLDRYLVKAKAGRPVDNELILACRKASWALGAMLSTVEALKPRADIPAGVIDLVEHPEKRVAAQLVRAKDRGLEIQRAAAAKPKPAPAKGSARAKAVSHALSFAGHTTESPAGSNKGPHITQWQIATARGATYLVGQAWCGVFDENMCRYAGVQTVPQWAGVANIEDMAKQGTGGFRGWTLNRHAVLRGDLVVLFGRGVHVELVREVTATAILTVGGNTSSGSSGNQSNGGGVFARARSFSDVHGFALVNYPG